MITMLFVSCDNNDNNNDDNSADAVSSDVLTGDVGGEGTEPANIDAVKEFANDNEAIYKDSWK